MATTTRNFAERVLAEYQDRQVRIRDAWAAYYGRFPDALVTRPGRPNDNLKVNFSKLIVNKTVSFLFGKEPDFQLRREVRIESDPVTGEEREVQIESPAEVWLNKCWEINKKMQLLQKAGQNGAVTGDVFLRILLAGPGRPFPRIINLSPEYLDVRVAGDDVDDVVRFTLQYQEVGENGEEISVRTTVRKAATAWEMVEERSVGDAPYQVVAVEPWQYSWPPIVHCQNLPAANEYHGRADLEPDVIQLNAGLNRVLSNINKIIRLHAHPKTWGKGFMADQLRVAPDETVVLPSENAALHNLEMQSDLRSSRELYLDLKEALHEISDTPAIAAGQLDNVGQLSGLALSILYGPLTEKTAQKRLTYGEMLLELNRHLLEAAGFDPSLVVGIGWPEMVPSDSRQRREVAVLDRDLGVSQDTILEALGYDPDSEREKREREDTAPAAGERALEAFDQGNGFDRGVGA